MEVNEPMARYREFQMSTSERTFFEDTGDWERSANHLSNRRLHNESSNEEDGRKLNTLHDMRNGLYALEERLESIEGSLVRILEVIQAYDDRKHKEWYTTSEVAKILGKRPYTVREWCRHGRVNAEKGISGRGLDEEWRISNDELQRIRNEGLLPIVTKY